MPSKRDAALMLAKHMGKSIESVYDPAFFEVAKMLDNIGKDHTDLLRQERNNGTLVDKDVSVDKLDGMQLQLAAHVGGIVGQQNYRYAEGPAMLSHPYFPALLTIALEELHNLVANKSPEVNELVQILTKRYIDKRDDANVFTGFFSEAIEALWEMHTFCAGHNPKCF
ncbi:hypothetical protein N9L68_04995 [bacterium]|nr:hypothetical protein [bacterium]